MGRALWLSINRSVVNDGNDTYVCDHREDALKRTVDIPRWVVADGGLSPRQIVGCFC